MSSDSNVQNIVDKVCGDNTSEEDDKSYEQLMEEHIKNNPAFKIIEYDSKSHTSIIVS